MNDCIRIVIDKYQEAINRFNEENIDSYQIRCFPNFVELRFYIFLDKLNRKDYSKNMSAKVYIEMEDLEKHIIYNVDKIYKNLNELIKAIY